MLDETQTYRILPGFVDADDPSLQGSVNGWNTNLERWLLEIQSECNRHYVMLIDTNRRLRVWKWIFIGLSCTIGLASALTTGIAVALDRGGIWLPIFSAVCAAITPVLFVVYEGMDYNSWRYECRNSAGEYIILGRNIESLKRVPRAERDRNGLIYTNDASITFETIRANQPPILDSVRRKHPRKDGINEPRSAGGIHVNVTLPDDLLSAAASTAATAATAPEDPGSGSPTVAADKEDVMMDDMERGDLPSQPLLQDLFMDRLRHVQEQADDEEELIKYENYIRQQYGKAVSAMTPRAIGPGGPAGSGGPVTSPRARSPSVVTHELRQTRRKSQLLQRTAMPSLVERGRK